MPVTKPVKRNLICLTASWSILISFFAFFDHFREITSIKKAAILIGICVAVGAVMAIISLLIERMLKRKLAHAGQTPDSAAKPGQTTSDKFIDFSSTAIFLMTLNYFYVSKAFPIYKNLVVNIAVASFAAFILAIYRPRIKSWIKRKIHQ